MNIEINSDVAAMADQFIELANGMCDDTKAAEVGLALAYATARFEAYIVSCLGEDLDSFKRERVTGSEYFTRQFQSLLTSNLDEYENKKSKALKYAKFMS